MILTQPLRRGFFHLGAKPLCLTLLYGILSLAGCKAEVSIDDLLDQSKQLLENNEHDTALERLDVVLKREPGNERGLLYRAQLARDENDDQLAQSLLAKISDRQPRVACAARYMEGSIELAMNHALKSEAALKHSMELNPKYVYPRERLLRLYVLQRRTAEVLTELQAISKLRQLELAEMALQLSVSEPTIDAHDGIPQLEAFVAADPSDFQSRLALAHYLYQSLRADEAIRLLRELIKDKPDFVEARAALADFYVDKQELAKAADVLAPVEVTDQSSLVVWRSAGNFYLAKEDWQRAVACFAYVARRESMDRSTFRRLGLALSRIGAAQLAEQALTRTSQIADLRSQCETLGIQLTRNQIRPENLLDLADRLAALDEVDLASVWYEYLQRANQFTFLLRERFERLPARESTVLNRFLAQLPSPNMPVTFQPINNANVQSASVDFDRQSTIQFRDDHSKLGMEFQYFNGETGFRYLIESMGGGVAVIDFDADGWPDYYFPQGNQVLSQSATSPKEWRDQLFWNRGEAGFVAVSDQAGVGDPGYGQGVAVGDFDNDGFDDLFVANYGRCSLLRNQGDGTFADVTNVSRIHREEMSTSVAWGDFDQDGLLDLFVVNYVDGLKVCRNDQGVISACSPSNHSGVDDRVYRNLGDGRFEDVSATCGLSPQGKGLGILLADFNDDGKIDAFVSNDTSPNFLYRNVSSNGKLQFLEEGLIAGVALSETGLAQAGMGIAFGDFNHDQRMDLYVTYFHREANGLYQNLGDCSFQEVTRAYDLYHPTFNMLGFGTQMVDFDLDGRPEIVVANGHVDDQRDRGIPWKMPPQLFALKNDQRFVERSSTAGDYFHGEYLGRAVVRTDWNRDGKPDVVIVHQDRPTAVLTNTTATAGKSLTIQLHARKGNRSAIGARVNVTCGDTTQRGDVTSGDGYYCSNERKLFFGVGSADQIDQVEIVWPGGARDVHSNLPANSEWVAVESSVLLPVQP